MVKKVIGAVVLVTLLTVMIVQAMEKKAEPQNQTQTTETASQKNGLEVGSKAPDFELKTLSGETFKLSNFKGKKVMLNFWATWCPPCKAEMPEMEQFYKQANQDITILAVNLDPENDVKGFISKNGITFPILMDTQDQVNRTYQIISIPTTYFIDGKGVIQNKFTGAMQLDMMKQFASQLK